MHVLFVHRSFPGQFGHIAARLIAERGWKASFVSERPPGNFGGVGNIQYAPEGAAPPESHYLARSFENGIRHASGVREALAPVSAALRPDLIVGHSGWGSTLFLHQLYPGVPVVNYFEYFYRPDDSDLDFRPDVIADESDRLRNPARNGMILLDLEYCAAGYSPTSYQRSLMPEAYRPKIRAIHDGIDTGLWRPLPDPPRSLGGLRLEPGEKLVTYVARGFEQMRGFDIFMRAVRRICEADPDVRVVIVGSDEVAYGAQLSREGSASLKDAVLAEGGFDLSRIHFAGNVQPQRLATLLAMSDLHIYLTVPFVLSWSMLNAMACGATVLASNTAPVQEVIRDGENGLLVDFFDDAALAERALEVLGNPGQFRDTIGAAGRETILENYALDVTFPRLAGFFEEVGGAD